MSSLLETHDAQVQFLNFYKKQFSLAFSLFSVLISKNYETLKKNSWMISRLTPREKQKRLTYTLTPAISLLSKRTFGENLGQLMYSLWPFVFSSSKYLMYIYIYILLVLCLSYLTKISKESWNANAFVTNSIRCQPTSTVATGNCSACVWNLKREKLDQQNKR